MPELSERHNDYRQTGFQFLKTELDTGLTFLRIALGAKGLNKNRVERNRMNARKAYDSAMHFLPSTSLNPEETVSSRKRSPPWNQVW